MPDVYNNNNGVPNPGKNLYPGTSDQGPMFTPNNGPTNADTTGSDSTAPGASFSGGEGDGLLKESGYHAPGEERVEGGMKIRDLNDISHNA